MVPPVDLLRTCRLVPLEMVTEVLASPRDLSGARRYFCGGSGECCQRKRGCHRQQHGKKAVLFVFLLHENSLLPKNGRKKEGRLSAALPDGRRNIPSRYFIVEPGTKSSRANWSACGIVSSKAASVLSR